ncbi:CPBP family intramembrane glutamic endopeptidase [Nesterenkonia ebinurensis]|uniref:CPBP family intramembrane glutamic endopeptidase n=1 Tax=Nesterenkonia ebinurensis TaxID=2608252 RepID=UPI00168AE5B9|nr:type II CAAX endopeptidase family protein [Nesterenkonia ebinurensis]
MDNSPAHDESQADHRVGSLALRLVLITTGTLLIWLGVTRLTTVLWGAEMSLLQHIANAVGVFSLAVPMVLVINRYLDRRPVSALGLHAEKRAWRDFLYGALTWLIPAGLGLTVALMFGWVEIRIDSSIAELIGVILLLILLVFVYEAFPEELIFRGYIYRNLTAAVAPWVAVVIQALLFSAFGTALWVISNGWGVFLERSVLFFGMAVVVGCVRLISGSLWAAIGFHLAFQVMMQLFLSSQYVDIEVSDEGIFTLTTAVVAFCAATTVAGLLWRGGANWTKPEPQSSESTAQAEASVRPAEGQS